MHLLAIPAALGCWTIVFGAIFVTALVVTATIPVWGPVAFWTKPILSRPQRTKTTGRHHCLPVVKYFYKC